MITAFATILPEGNLSSAPIHNRVPSTSSVIYAVVWTIIIIPGIFGNILSLTVLYRAKDTSTTSKLLKSLAVADTMVLMFRGLKLILDFGNCSYHYIAWTLSVNLLTKLLQMSERISKYVTVAIAFERVVAVTRPFRYKSICTSNRVVAIIVMICFIVVSVSIPDIVEIFIFSIDADNNKTIQKKKDGIYLGRRSFKPYKTPIQLNIEVLNSEFLPVLLVMVCNIIIILGLQKGLNAGKATTVQQRKLKTERKLTKLLLTISVMFFILCGPFAISRVIMKTGISFIKESPFLLDILWTLVLVNYSINFLVYCAMNKKYREGFIAIFSCFRRRNPSLHNPTIEIHVTESSSKNAKLL